MSETNEQPSPQTEAAALQFDTVEASTSSGTNCGLCQKTLESEYHELNGQAICALCRTKEEALHGRDREWSRFPTALVYGFGAAIVGAILYWGFVKITDIELGLMAIAIGWLVGKAVMKGSNMRGGRRYQILALSLTYFAITMSYGALIIEQMLKNPKQSEQGQAAPKSQASPPNGQAPVKEEAKEEELTAAGAAIGLGFLFLIFLASPFLAGFSNIMGWIIIAIGLWEAWKQTKEQPFVTGGPYALGQSAPPPPDDPEPATT